MGLKWKNLAELNNHSTPNKKICIYLLVIKWGRQHCLLDSVCWLIQVWFNSGKWAKICAILEICEHFGKLSHTLNNPLLRLKISVFLTDLGTSGQSHKHNSTERSATDSICLPKVTAWTKEAKADVPVSLDTDVLTKSNTCHCTVHKKIFQILESLFCFRQKRKHTWTYTSHIKVILRNYKCLTSWSYDQTEHGSEGQQIHPQGSLNCFSVSFSVSTASWKAQLPQVLIPNFG